MFYDEQNHARHAWWHRDLIRDLCRHRHNQLVDVTKNRDGQSCLKGRSAHPVCLDFDWFLHDELFNIPLFPTGFA